MNANAEEHHLGVSAADAEYILLWGLGPGVHSWECVMGKGTSSCELMTYAIKLFHSFVRATPIAHHLEAFSHQVEVTLVQHDQSFQPKKWAKQLFFWQVKGKCEMSQVSPPPHPHTHTTKVSSATLFLYVNTIGHHLEAFPHTFR